MIKSIDGLFDELLNISTDANQQDVVCTRKAYFNYGPTEYCFLERLFQNYPFTEEDHIVDFGCGKGRVLVMAAYYLCRNLTGYELDVDRHNTAILNFRSFQKKYNYPINYKILWQNAEQAVIDATANKFFFFRPFHLKVYIKLFDRILESVKQYDRKIYLFLYFPFQDTVQYLDSLGTFLKLDENKCYRLNKRKNTVDYEYVIYANR